MIMTAQIFYIIYLTIVDSCPYGSSTGKNEGKHCKIRQNIFSWRKFWASITRIENNWKCCYGAWQIYQEKSQKRGEKKKLKNLDVRSGNWTRDDGTTNRCDATSPTQLVNHFLTNPEYKKQRWAWAGVKSLLPLSKDQTISSCVSGKEEPQKGYMRKLRREEGELEVPREGIRSSARKEFPLEQRFPTTSCVMCRDFFWEKILLFVAVFCILYLFLTCSIR